MALPRARSGTDSSVEMLFRLLVAAFVLAHGAIHAAFVAPRPPVSAGARCAPEGPPA